MRINSRDPFQVRLAGSSPDAETTLALRDFPMENLKSNTLMPGRTTELETFKGQSAEGRAENVHKLTVARMDAGDAALQASQKGFRIEGRMTHVSFGVRE